MSKQHKTTTKRCSSRPNTVVCTCTCGWQQALGLDDWRVRSMREVWREIGYLRQDHKAGSE